MHRTGFCSLMAACALAFAVPGAAAQTTPSVKPGLWQIDIQREENGQNMPDGGERMKERMKKMPPEQRQRIEEMMKQRGIAPGDDGMTKVCYSRKMVEQRAWADQGGCKTDYSNRSATSWKWHSSCPQVGYEGDGEATFPDAENFVVKSSGISTIGGKTHKSNSTRTGKWLAADCGDLKPMDSSL